MKGQKHFDKSSLIMMNGLNLKESQLVLHNQINQNFLGVLIKEILGKNKSSFLKKRVLSICEYRKVMDLKLLGNFLIIFFKV